MKKNAKPFWAVAYVLIFLAIQVVAQTFVLGIKMLKDGTEVQQLDAMGTIIAMALFSLTAIILFTLMEWSPVSKAYILSRPWGVLAWSLIAALGAIVPSMGLQELMPQWPEAIQRYIDQAEAMACQMMSTTGGYAVVCLLAPVAEEVVFRGAVLHTLLQWRPDRRWAMIALSALLFAMAHLNPAQLIHPLLIGLLLGWMYERTGSIVPGIVYHWANNTVAYLLFHAYPAPGIGISDIFGQPANVMLAVGFSLLILVPAIYQLHLLMPSGKSSERHEQPK